MGPTPVFLPEKYHDTKCKICDVCTQPLMAEYFLGKGVGSMRKKLSRSGSKSLFMATANNTRAANLSRSVPRGGRRF